MNYVIPSELLKEVLNYLADRPFKDVLKVLPPLLKCIEEQNASRLHEEQRKDSKVTEQTRDLEVH